MLDFLVEPTKFPMTHRTGTVIGIGFEELVELLGPPNAPDDGYKVDACWAFCDIDDPGAAFSIWNYKNGPNYTDGEASMDNISQWSLWCSNDKGRELAKRVFGDRI